MGYLDNTGLAYFWEKIKSNFFPGTKEIPANADLNDYRTPGVYYCPQNTTAATLDNAPVPYAFSLQVYRTVWTSEGDEGCRQILMTYHSTETSDQSNRVWIRSYYKSKGWTEWYQIVTSMDRPVEYTSVGWEASSFNADNVWYKVATFSYNEPRSDRRVVFTVTDSYMGGLNAPNGRADLKYGILHVHIRRHNDFTAEGLTTSKLTWHLVTGYDVNDFVMVYIPSTDVLELWTRVPNRYNYRTFNLIENGNIYGGNRYNQHLYNPIELYGKVSNTGAQASYPTGEGYYVIKSEPAIVEQPSRSLVDLGVTYTGKIGTRLSNANAFLAGKGVLEYYNSTSSMSVANGAFTYPDDTSRRDAHVLRLPWDNVGASDGACYDSMLAVPNSNIVNSNGYPASLGWRTGYGAGCAELDADGNMIHTKYSDWYHLIDDRYTIDGVHVKKQHTTHYGVCSTAAATEVKTVDIPHFELVPGAFVIVTFAEKNTAAVAKLKLNVSNTGDIPIKHRNGNFPAAGDMIANRPFMFVYDGTNWQLVIDIDHDNNNYERLKTYWGIKAKTAITAKSIVVAGADGLYFHLSTGNAFDIRYSPLYAGSSIKANAVGADAYFMFACNNAVVTNNAAETLVPHKPVYIKGHLNGTTFTPFAAKSLVCTEPTVEDGYQYLKLGTVKDSSGPQVQIEIDHPIYEYVNGSFCLYEPKATNEEIDAIFYDCIFSTKG